MTSFYETTFYLALCLLPAALASGLQNALVSLGKVQGKEEIENKFFFPHLFFFKSIKPEHFWNFSLFAIQLTKAFYYLIFSFVSFYFFFILESSEGTRSVQQLKTLSFYFSSLLEILFVFFIGLSIEFLTTCFTKKHPQKAIRLLSLPNSIFMIPCLPFIFFYAKFKELLGPLEGISDKPPLNLKDKLFEYLNQSELRRYLDKTEIKLIHTVISLKDRIVREVMVPRIDIFALPCETSLKEAARYFSLEGYSRIPVYRENIDTIIGILLYKDVLAIYTEHLENENLKEVLDKPIDNLVKPVLYTPETKKISQLLQEFRNKQIHLAIIVDEYGGTEGIITIEDILEELVGEIEDEHDTHEEKIYSPLSSGGWIVDAKMNIIDLEEDLGIKIPPSSEYDTIGGYIFHRTGSIPHVGWKLHLDDIDLEILSSDPRSIQKIKITPRSYKNQK